MGITKIELSYEYFVGGKFESWRGPTATVNDQSSLQQLSESNKNLVLGTYIGALFQGTLTD